ncbi:MAG: hypothetical protein IJQ74_02335, partial [Synergistaceae bacterium]|nr:hypothetical protein [Synergistaceae bacterium]
MRIYHNISALTAYNSLNKTNNAMDKTIQKLSTGLRINSAADDAAGFAISEKMRAQISGLEVAIRNTQDATSMLQVAEGALGETNSMLQRMRELAVQASNDTLTSQDRSYIQLEIDQLEDQIDRIAKTTQFNKKRLLDGSSAGITSSSNLSVKAYVRGSLREIDQFGQKKSFEGNYKIQVKVDPSQAGQGQVQKSSVMTIKHPNVITDVNVDNGIQKVTVDNLPAGDYSVTRGSSGIPDAFEVVDFTSAKDTPSEIEVATEKKALSDAITLNITADLNPGTSGAEIKLTVKELDNSTSGQEKVTLTASTTINGTEYTKDYEFTVGGTLSYDIAADLGLSDTAANCTIRLDDTVIPNLIDDTNDNSTRVGSEITYKAYKIISDPEVKKSKFTSAAATTAAAETEETAFDDAISVELADNAVLNKLGNNGAKITFKVTEVDDTANSVTLTATSSVKKSDGSYYTSSKNITLDVNTASVDLSDLGLSDTPAQCNLAFDTTQLATLIGAATVGTEIEYTIKGSDASSSKLTGFYNAGTASDAEALSVITFNSDNSQTANASVLFEITGIDKNNNTVTLRATSNVLGTDGNVSNYLEDSIIVNTSPKGFGEKLGLGSDDACQLSLDEDKIANLE